MDIQNIVISCLVFGAVICFVWTIRNIMPNSTDDNNSDKIPALFRIFGTGIFFFAAEAGHIMTGMFSKQSKKIEESLHKADIPLEVKDIYGAQIFFFLFGGIIGIIFGGFVSYVIVNAAGWALAFSWTAVVLALGFSTLVGVFFGWYPAMKASKLDPIAALSYE